MSIFWPAYPFKWCGKAQLNTLCARRWPLLNGEPLFEGFRAEVAEERTCVPGVIISPSRTPALNAATVEAGRGGREVTGGQRLSHCSAAHTHTHTETHCRLTPPNGISVARKEKKVQIVSALLLRCLPLRSANNRVTALRVTFV